MHFFSDFLFCAQYGRRRQADGRELGELGWIRRYLLSGSGLAGVGCIESGVAVMQDGLGFTDAAQAARK